MAWPSGKAGACKAPILSSNLGATYFFSELTLLYIVTTPIGHLEDISYRAIKILQECDAILCEDTRHSSTLLNRYNIKKPLIAYHKFNEASILTKTLQDLQAGQNLVLISDAGTPCINDPGGRLTAACVENRIPFTAIPGPCSIIQALVLSAFPLDQFQFIGFLPKKPKKIVRQILFYPGCTVAFESPERFIQNP